MQKEILRQELLALLRGGNAHMDFDEVVADFPLDHINRKAPNVPYTPWHFLEHMRITQWDILEFIRNPRHVSPDYPQGYRPSPDAMTDRSGWRKTIEAFRTDLKALEEMVADISLDLFAPIPHAPGYTIFREIILVADHNAYHIGELAILRQVMELWPGHRPYLTGTPEL